MIWMDSSQSNLDSGVFFCSLDFLFESLPAPYQAGFGN